MSLATQTRISDYDHALVRAVPRQYVTAYRSKGIHINPSLADSQHAAYVSALREAGATVHVVEADEHFYDCVFVEDTAIVWRKHALVTRMTDHREGEQRGVCAALDVSHTLTRLTPGARLEGGDVLSTESTTYVGLTERTNERGVAQLTEFMSAFRRRVVPVPVSNALHLKTAATYLGDGRMLVAPGRIDIRKLDVEEIIETGHGEAGAANCVRVRDTLIARSGYPATLGRLRRFAEAHGVSIVTLDLSEFEKGDGSATCLSLLWHGARA